MSDKLSAESYLRKGNVRKLPIYKCWATAGYKNHGMANVIVSRKHKNGHISAGFYLVDLYCLGIKDSMFIFNTDESEFMANLVDKDSDLEEVSYEFAHNLVYGADAYCEDIGLSSHKTFKDTQLALNEDTDDIELIYFEFGLNGKPHLVTNPYENRNKERAILEKKFGTDGFTYIARADFEDFDDYDDEVEDYDIASEMNDNDLPYYFNLSDADFFKQLISFKENQSEEGIKKWRELINSESAHRLVALEMSIDAIYLSEFENFNTDVANLQVHLPNIAEENRNIDDYLSNDELLEAEFEELHDVEENIDNALTTLLENNSENPNVYTFVESFWEYESDKLTELHLKFYNKFPDMLFSRAKLLVAIAHDNEEVGSFDQTLKKLPFRITPTLNFHEYNSVKINCHIAELSAFLFLSGFAYCFEEKIIEAEKCLIELAKLRVKHHEFFYWLRTSVSVAKQKALEDLDS